MAYAELIFNTHIVILNMNRWMLFFRIFVSALLIIAFCGCKAGKHASTTSRADEEYPLELSDMHIRDPFILADATDSTYYMHANSGKNSFACYASKDLRHWKLCGESFIPEPSFWGERDFWAPKIYRYNDRYYLIASFYSEQRHRGISILVSERPDRDFQPIVNAPVTPEGWMCLDGSLYIDKTGAPWLVYAREWIEVGIGEMYAQRLSEDLSQTVGDPVFLFRGSDADWPGLITTGAQTGVITNSPFIYTTDSGKLLLTWSSFCANGEYAIGVAVSRSGELGGSWKQLSGAINDDGGHAMIFRDFQGSLLISYHTNEPPVQVVLRPIRIEQERVAFLN